MGSILTIVNIVVGAYSPGFKALWLGFLSNGSLGDVYTDHDGISVVVTILHSDSWSCLVA
ncbi:MAG: hypothetical protein Ct9H90mP14_1780 [Methanobacteriota archaeon]|nr:MAG: hypothetical protein Ct9H90mP14_1780 [Euryarchaeota archaeon]